MITYSVVSECGNREYNEDSIVVSKQKDAYCFALADGLGGQGNGKIASETVVNWIEQNFAVNGFHDAFVQEAFRGSQEYLCQKKASNHYGDMMTTLVMMAVDKQIQWGHIGDSRLYYFKDRQLVSQTLDHSVPQILVYVNEITPDEIRHHPDRNRLLKAMGKIWDKGDEFVIAEPVFREGFQAFLLCSDGFWEHIEEAEMQFTLQNADSVSQWLADMKEIVKKKGEGYNMDNFSAIAVWIMPD